jgi:aspartyl-tRNA synthetase
MPFREARKNMGAINLISALECCLMILLNTQKEKTSGFQFSRNSFSYLCRRLCRIYPKKLDALTEYVKRQQIGAKGLVYVRYGMDKTLKSSVDKFYSEEDLKKWAEVCNAKPGDLILILSGEKAKTRIQMGALRLEMAKQMNLIDKNVYKPLWVVDVPLLEWDEKTGRYHAMHHPLLRQNLRILHFLILIQG